MTVDTRLLGYWKRERARRERARRALPERWLADPRPEMAAVADAYVELLAHSRGNVVRFRHDDR